MRPNQIRAKLVEAGVTNSQIAKGFEVSNTAVSRVIYGQSTSKRIQTAISAVINLPFSEVWLERRN